MFNSAILNIPSLPSALKKQIYTSGGTTYDDTLIGTALVLLYERANNLKIDCFVGNVDQFEAVMAKVEATDKNVYSFYWFWENKENPDELMDKVCNKAEGYEKLPTHDNFLSKQLGQNVYVRFIPTANTACIFVEKMNLTVWHCIQFIMPKMFPVFKEKPLTKEETTFLESLTHKTNKMYLERITELMNKQSFRMFAIKNQLYMFEKKLFEKKVQCAAESLTSIENAMQRAMEEYRKACAKRTEALALVDGLKNMADATEEHTELQNYLINNERICNVALENSNISFIVKTFLAPHHIEEWDTISKTGRIFARYTDSGYTMQEIKLLLDAIFSSERCLRLRMCAYFNVDYFGTAVTSRSRYNYVEENPDLINYMPNPHLYYHNCFGQNKLTILDQLTQGDAVGAIECCIACTQRVNIHESMTFDPFIDAMLVSKGKCIVAEDGTEMTASEAITYLKGRNNV